jgi:hypothetical protein
MVTVPAPLTKPTPVCWKVNKEGRNCTEPGVPPVPLSGTTADVSEVDATVSVPVYDPLRAGEKTTPVEQFAPLAKLAGQPFCTRLNGDVAARVSALADEPLLLVMVTV